MKSSIPLVLALLSATLVGCDDDNVVGPVCAPSYGAAVVVTARDAHTGRPLPAAGTRGAIRDGTFADSLVPVPLQAPEVLSMQAGGDRAGTYTVTLERDGYRSWTREGVVATRGVCGINSTVLIADLEQLP